MLSPEFSSKVTSEVPFVVRYLFYDGVVLNISSPHDLAGYLGSMSREGTYFAYFLSSRLTTMGFETAAWPDATVSGGEDICAK